MSSPPCLLATFGELSSDMSCLTYDLARLPSLDPGSQLSNLVIRHFLALTRNAGILHLTYTNDASSRIVHSNDFLLQNVSAAIFLVLTI